MTKDSNTEASYTPEYSPGVSPDDAGLHRRWHGLVVFLLRVSVIGFFLSVCAQVVLGVMFVTGEVQLLALHERNSNSFLSGFLFAAVPLAILLWRPLRGPAGPLWWTLGLIVLTEAVKVLGFSRMIGLHIGTGVLTFGLSMLFVSWALRYRHRPRPRTPKSGKSKERVEQVGFTERGTPA